MTRQSFYLGPRKDRLRAETWEDVVGAAVAGVLDETQWVELKEAVPASSKPANLELARDLASLSLDGGLIIIGVADAGGTAGQVTGTDLIGLETRIAQVATGRVNPPLTVLTDVIRKPGETDVGLLMVTVPASEAAPHMVDERYWGRGAHGKRVLSDDEIRRVMVDRQSRAAGFSERLQNAPTNLDPPDLGSLGRLYLRLEPAAVPAEPLGQALAGQHLRQITAPGLTFRPQWSPLLESLDYAVPHPEGIAAASTPPGANGDGVDYIFALLADDGTVQVSAPAIRPHGQAVDAPGKILPGQLLETMHGTLAVAGYLASEHTGYQGPWRAGVLITGLRGVLATQSSSDAGVRRYSPYPSEDYAATTATTTREMIEETSSVVNRLSARVLRGLGVASRFLPYTDPAEIYRNR